MRQLLWACIDNIAIASIFVWWIIRSAFDFVILLVTGQVRKK